jgi:hypothetical protein
VNDLSYLAYVYCAALSGAQMIFAGILAVNRVRDDCTLRSVITRYYQLNGFSQWAIFPIWKTFEDAPPEIAVSRSSGPAANRVKQRHVEP